MSVSIVVCIPTLNPGQDARHLAAAIIRQSVAVSRLMVIDSSSDDGSMAAFEKIGAEIHVIERKDFDHGGTRNLAFSKVDADIYIFMTQDAIPEDEYAIENIIKAFEDKQVGAAFGRQLPADNATAVAEHARLYNYSEESRVVSKEDIQRLGIKAAFCSNSFAAYRKKAIEEVGFFPSKLIFGEDGYAAGKMILSGWSIAYVADAQAVHSHNYSLKQELARYFDLGVFHREESWLLNSFGKPEGEGMRFVGSEYAFLKRNGVKFSFVKIVIRNGFRYMGYMLGRRQVFLPKKLKLFLTMNKAYWLKEG